MAPQNFFLQNILNRNIISIYVNLNYIESMRVSTFTQIISKIT